MAYSSVLQEFLIRFGFRMDQMSANATLQSLGSIGGKLNMAARVGLSAFRVLSGEILHTSNEMANLQLSADRLGLSAGSLDNILMATKAAGGNEADALKTLQSIQLKIGEGALRIGMGAQTFRKFGISIYDTNLKLKRTDVLLGEVAARFRTIGGDKLIDPRVRNALARQFGMSEDFARVLAGDFGEMLEATHKMGEAFEYNMDKMGRSAASFKKELGKTVLLFRIIRRSFVGDNIGWFADRLSNINNIVIKNADGISFYKSLLSKATKGLFAVIDSIMRVSITLWGFLGKLLNYFGEIGKGIILLISGFGALEGILYFFGGSKLLASFGIIAAGIGAIIASLLILDDILTYARGGESYFSDLYDMIQDLAGVVIGILTLNLQIDKLFTRTRTNSKKWFTEFWKSDTFEKALKKAAENTDLWMKDKKIGIYAVGRDPRDEQGAFIDMYKAVMKFFGWDDNKNQQETGFQKLMDFLKEYFDKFLKFFSLDIFFERLKATLMWMNDPQPDKVPGYGNPTEEIPKNPNNPDDRDKPKNPADMSFMQILQNSIGKFTQFINKETQKKDKEKVDSLYGRMSNGQSYNKYYGAWYADRNKEYRQFGREPGNKKARAEDKYFADKAEQDDDYAHEWGLYYDEIPDKAKTGDYYDLNHRYEDFKPKSTPKPKAEDKKVSSNFMQPMPELSLDSTAFKVASNSNQNVVVNTSVNVSGAGDPQEVANKVIAEQYNVATSTAGIIRPYLNESAYS